VIEKQFYPLIRRALERDGINATVDQVLDTLYEGRAQLWKAKSNQSLAITYFSTDPDGRKVCNGWIIAGDMTEIMTEVIPSMIEQVKDIVDVFRQEGNPAYQRILNKLGFKTKKIVMEL